MNKILLILILSFVSTHSTSHLIILGPHGAGKGTCAQFLMKQKPTYRHISIGDLLRKEVNKQTELGKAIEADVAAGRLIPQHLTLAILKKNMQQIIQDNQQFILDGFPRTARGVHDLVTLINELGVSSQVCCIHIHAPTNICIERICKRLVCDTCEQIYTENESTMIGDRCTECNGQLTRRSNDERHIAEQRLNNYHETIAPVETQLEQHFPTVAITNDGSLTTLYNILKKKVMPQ